MIQFYHLNWLWIGGVTMLFLIGLLIYTKRKKSRLLRIFGQEETLSQLMEQHATQYLRWKSILLILGISFLFASLAQPQWGEEKKQLKRKGIDIVFMVDTSLSMLAQDVKPSRFEKSRFLLKTFLKHLSGAPVGIITIYGSGFLQSPLTLDYSAFTLFANAIQVGYIPDTATNLNDGIQAAIRSFPKDDKKHKAIVILSDGEVTEGEMEGVPDVAQKANVRIYAIGIGTADGDPIPLHSDNRKVSGYKKDSQGQIVITKLNEELLKKLAKETGGLYFQATPSEAEVELIYQHMQGLGKKELKERIITQREERYQLFLAIGFSLILIETLLGDRTRLKKETYDEVS